jgi:hypothetical protein
MNLTLGRCLQCFSTVMLAGAFLIATEIPLLANPLPSDQSSNAEQKGGKSLPDAPQPQSAPAPQQSTQAQTGAAGAKAGNVKGTPAAQPIGAAVAPVRQKSHRSLLIKLGLLAGVGVAVGTAVALSEASPSRPPGTSSSTHR